MHRTSFREAQVLGPQEVLAQLAQAQADPLLQVRERGHICIGQQRRAGPAEGEGRHEEGGVRSEEGKGEKGGVRDEGERGEEGNVTRGA